MAAGAALRVVEALDTAGRVKITDRTIGRTALASCGTGQCPRRVEVFAGNELETVIECACVGGREVARCAIPINQRAADAVEPLEGEGV